MATPQQEKKIEWQELQEYMKVLNDHYETMKSFMNLVEKGKMDKQLVETLCSP